LFKNEILYENRKFNNNVDWLLCHVFPPVPKLQLGNGLAGKLQLPLLMGIEAGASAQLCSQAGAWEQEAKDLHPIHNIFMLRCDPTGSWGLLKNRRSHRESFHESRKECTHHVRPRGFVREPGVFGRRRFFRSVLVFAKGRSVARVSRYEERSKASKA
jgi:hypothetical protein